MHAIACLFAGCQYIYDYEGYMSLKLMPVQLNADNHFALDERMKALYPRICWVQQNWELTHISTRGT